MERLQKIIANSGYTSRRKAEELIAAGKVEVNGKIITELGYKANTTDTILVEGNLIDQENKVYYVINKPKKCICTLDDEFDRKKVVDYLVDVKERVYPVGRLDYDTTGVLFLTNDGDFANLMMHPSSHLEKIYEATLEGLIDGKSLHTLEKGIYLDGVKTLPCKIKVISKDPVHKSSIIQIKLVEGKNRQVKKMFDYVGFPVKRLHRIQIGFINVVGMNAGEYRRLKPQEIKDLKKLANEKKSRRA